MKTTKTKTKINSTNLSIVDEINYNDQAIAIFKEEDLTAVKVLSGDLAVHNEYQVHYLALVRQLLDTRDNSSIYMVFPLVYFNYPQEVAGAKIDFEMKDVKAKIEEYAPLAQEKANKLIDKFKPVDDKTTLFNAHKPVIKYKITLMNNIHRHP